MYAANVTRERLAIVHKGADGAGTYTPPGHWNEIASHYIENANFSEVRAARAFALLNVCAARRCHLLLGSKVFLFQSEANPA